MVFFGEEISTSSSTTSPPIQTIQPTSIADTTDLPPTTDSQQANNDERLVALKAWQESRINRYSEFLGVPVGDLVIAPAGDTIPGYFLRSPDGGIFEDQKYQIFQRGEGLPEPEDSNAGDPEFEKWKRDKLLEVARYTKTPLEKLVIIPMGRYPDPVIQQDAHQLLFSTGIFKGIPYNCFRDIR